MQLLRFDGEAFLRGLSEDSPPKVSALIDAMVAGKDVLEATVWGDWRHRFSETQILQALGQ